MADIKQQPYEIPVPAAGGFLGAVDLPDIKTYLQQDLAASGIPPEYMMVKPSLTRSENYDKQYYIPYFDAEGNVITDDTGMIRMYRMKGALTSKGKQAKLGKYASPSRSQVGDAATMPYLHPEIWELPSKVVCITEGEKKAASLMYHARVPCVGIGGKDNWHTAGNQRDLHPVIDEVLKKLDPDEVWVIPDGDILKNDIASSYGSFKDCLEAAGYSVKMPQLPGYKDKIDDLIVGKWQGKDVWEELSKLPPVENYVQSLQSLVQRYHLQHATSQRGAVQVKANGYNISTLIAQHPMFEELWYDEDTQSVMVGAKRLDDTIMTELCDTFMYRMSMPDTNQRVFARSLYRIAKGVRARSPWRDYLSGLTWDGVPRLETFFMDYCGAADSDVARETGSKWLPGAVARSFEPGCKVDYMVVTQGAQGVGKSMLPQLIWGKEHVTEILGSPNEKDMLMAMHMGRLASFEEMASFKGNKELNHLKALISGTEDTFRRPYAEHSVSEPRTFVLYGSVNETNFLMADPSGYRRFPIIPITAVDFSAVVRDRDQLWAEAVASYRDGVAYWIIESASAAAQLHVVENEEAEAIHAVVCAAAFGDSKIGPSWGFKFTDYDDGQEYFGFKIREARQAAGLVGNTQAAVKQSLGTLGYCYHSQRRILGTLHKSLWTVPLSEVQ